MVGKNSVATQPSTGEIIRLDTLSPVSRARHLLLDWDGCLVERGALKHGAQRLLRLAAGRVSVVSNNSTDTPASLSQLLARHGVHVPPAQFFLAGDVTLQLVAARAGQSPVCLLANKTMENHARSLGIRLGRRSAREVVLLRDTSFSFEKLDRAANLLRAGARLSVANPDLTHPCGDRVTPETGALLAALMSCVDVTKVDVSIVGKPSPTLFERALAAAQCGANQVVMIGDGPSTDIAGADRLGIPAVRIGGQSGVTLDDVIRALPANSSDAVARAHDPTAQDRDGARTAQLVDP